LEEQVSVRELGRAINSYLKEVDQLSRVAFVYRYYYGDSVKEIARILGVRENVVSLRLSRLKKHLRSYLMEEGYAL
jgi:RNA polymerase sigma-70 factor (ECF subfamily)